MRKAENIKQKNIKKTGSEQAGRLIDRSNRFSIMKTNKGRMVGKKIEFTKRWGSEESCLTAGTKKKKIKSTYTKKRQCQSLAIWLMAVYVYLTDG